MESITLFVLSLVIYLGHLHRPAGDKLLLELVAEFEAEAEARGVELPSKLMYIQFDPFLESNQRRVGECWPSTGTVFIDVAFRQAPRQTLRYVVFHELFHCMGDLVHHPEGIMRPQADYTVYTEQEWQTLLDEAFSRVGEGGHGQAAEIYRHRYRGYELVKPPTSIVGG